MSHSTVLVIGDNPEEMLAPYSVEIAVEPYRDYEEGEPGDFWWVRSVRRGAEHYRNGTGLDEKDRRSAVCGRPPATLYADDPVDRWCLYRPDSLEAFITRGRAGVGMTFAVLDHEGWHERGRVGWFRHCQRRAGRLAGVVAAPRGPRSR